MGDESDDEDDLEAALFVGVGEDLAANALHLNAYFVVRDGSWEPLTSAMSLGMMVTRWACIAARFASSKRYVRYVSAAS